nr:upf0665 family protein c23c4.06c [Quercus suber]
MRFPACAVGSVWPLLILFPPLALRDGVLATAESAADHITTVRFLKTPKVVVDRTTKTDSLKAVITVTTDLGETFYPYNLDLVATVRNPHVDGDIFLRRKLQWLAGSRSLPVELNLSRQDMDWPACLHIAIRNPDGRLAGFLPPIVDIWSGAMDPTQQHFESGHRVERRFTSMAERTVSLLEDAGDSIARHLWDGSQVLAQHIDQTISLQAPASPLPLLEYVLVSATFRRLNLIELGCGCGSVGISVAQAIPDCDVLLTDLPEARELVQLNIARMQPAMSARVRFQPLDWEEHAQLPEALRRRTNDLIVVSECTYNVDTLQPLVDTLVALVDRSPKAVIIVATKTRHDSEKAFFDLMRAAHFIEDGAMRFPLPGQPGDGYADWATDVGLHVFRGSQHRLSLSPRERSEENITKE